MVFMKPPVIGDPFRSGVLELGEVVRRLRALLGDTDGRGDADGAVLDLLGRANAAARQSGAPAPGARSTTFGTARPEGPRTGPTGSGASSGPIPETPARPPLVAQPTSARAVPRPRLQPLVERGQIPTPLQPTDRSRPGTTETGPAIEAKGPEGLFLRDRQTLEAEERRRAAERLLDLELDLERQRITVPGNPPVSTRRASAQEKTKSEVLYPLSRVGPMAVIVKQENQNYLIIDPNIPTEQNLGQPLLHPGNTAHHFTPEQAAARGFGKSLPASPREIAAIEAQIAERQRSGLSTADEPALGRMNIPAIGRIVQIETEDGRLFAAERPGTRERLLAPGNKPFTITEAEARRIGLDEWLHGVPTGTE